MGPVLHSGNLRKKYDITPFSSGVLAHDESPLAFATLYSPAYSPTPLKALGIQQEAKLNFQH